MARHARTRRLRGGDADAVKALGFVPARMHASSDPVEPGWTEFAMGATKTEWVAEGVVRLARASVNMYVLAADGGITVVDAGLPMMWPQLKMALGLFGASVDDIDALVLTHGHVDHVGVARRLAESSVPVHVHSGDRRLAQHPPFRFPSAARPLAATLLAGALSVRGVAADVMIRPGGVLDVPGRLRAVWSPGHTDGHCAFVHEGTGSLFSGDALVTLDPYTGQRGPRVIARSAAADIGTALRSLDALQSTDAGAVLPGHGEPYAGGIAAAVIAARSAGIG